MQPNENLGPCEVSHNTSALKYNTTGQKPLPAASALQTRHLPNLETAANESFNDATI